jgi:hypothetical protein
MPRSDHGYTLPGIAGRLHGGSAWMRGFRVFAVTPARIIRANYRATGIYLSKTIFLICVRSPAWIL